MQDKMQQLKILAIERRPEACLGCGFEQGCSVHGCAVINALADELSAWRKLGSSPEAVAARLAALEAELEYLRDEKSIAETLNPAGMYAYKFAKNHGISFGEAMERPMVKARFEYFAQTGM